MKAAEWLGSRLPSEPRVLLVLGSGLSHMVSELSGSIEIPFEAIPGLPPAGVEGHAGRFVSGSLEGVDVLIQAGRYHLYEGHPEEVVVAPVRIARSLGVEAVVVTNASGAVGKGLAPGDLVLIRDHLNLMFRNPLRGSVHPGEDRFPDMSEPYDAALRRAAQRIAGELGLTLHPGVYAAVLGPSFETAAEVRMLAGLGADVVGMSTVPEVIVARASGLRCLGFSVVTNLGTGLSDEPIDHREVMRIGRQAGAKLGRIVRGLLGTWDQGSSGTGTK